MEEQTADPKIETSRAVTIKTSVKVLVFGAAFIMAVAIYILARPSGQEGTAREGLAPVPQKKETAAPEPSPSASGANLTSTMAENQASGGSASRPAAQNQSPIDFDYELEKLDERVNSVDEDDFDDSELSNSKAGL